VSETGEKPVSVAVAVEEGTFFLLLPVLLRLELLSASGRETKGQVIVVTCNLCLASCISLLPKCSDTGNLLFFQVLLQWFLINALMFGDFPAMVECENVNAT
jgi:pheromone shutdown protein TraB